VFRHPEARAQRASKNAGPCGAASFEARAARGHLRMTETKEQQVMPKIDIVKLALDPSTNYPDPFHRVVEGRARKRLGNAAGLDQFGVNLTTLKPGAASALRHWHEKEDEFVYILEGEVVLVENDGETVLKPGDAAGFKANDGIGHQLVNKSNRDVVYLEIGTRSKYEKVDYPDVDMMVVRDDNGMRYTHKNGKEYPKR
jgi:uncharacterized cupin superfamily protein